MVGVAGSPPSAGTSFRDPAGYVTHDGGRILRHLSAEGAQNLREFLDTAAARQLTAQRELPATVFLSPTLAEHEKIEFVSYPFEWPAEMLHRAAAFTLELCESLLPCGYWLKDANPYNVLFRGPEPVFVDLGSFERRDPLNHTWLPYAQFSRTFLLPLLAARRLNRPAHETLLARRDGLEPGEVYRWAGLRQRLSPGFLGMVSLPVWLDRRRNPEDPGLYAGKRAPSAEQAAFILERLYRGLRKSLDRVQPAPAESTWTGYLDHKSLYSPGTLAVKESFVKAALDEFRPNSVLDLGCNEGHFSVLAAEAGARVVAVDFDAAVVGRVYERARSSGHNILPLVVNLARPTPGTGWNNEECLSFLDRARGSFDLTLMLALIHHLLVTERVPLRSLLQTAASLTRDLTVIEFVGPEDPMFRRLVRGRDLLYRDLTVDQFRRETECFFTTLRVHRIEGLDRWLFLLRKRSAPTATTC